MSKLEPKFKQTDIGLIPNDWECKLFYEIAEFTFTEF